MSSLYLLHKGNRGGNFDNRSDAPSNILKMPLTRNRTGLWRYVLLGLTAIYVVLSLYLILDTRSRFSSFKRTQQAMNQRLWMRQAVTESDLKYFNESFAQKLGATEQELHQSMQASAAESQRQQRTLVKQFQAQQQGQAAQEEQIGRVSGKLANVRTELGRAKVDIASTRTDLESTNLNLERAVGDLTSQSSLVARTREELEELKHRGDREYYEFTLSKGAHAAAVATVSLQLKSVNPKKNKFTMNVIADDRTIEKKDRGIAEPLQFYAGRDRHLDEVVIFSVNKDSVTGYLSTPKSFNALASR